MDLLTQMRTARDTIGFDLAASLASPELMGGSSFIGQDAVKGLLESASAPDLVAAYHRTNGEPDSPEANALLAEIERRGPSV